MSSFINQSLITTKSITYLLILQTTIKQRLCYITRLSSESTGAIGWDGSNDAVSEAALSVRTVPMMHRPCRCHHNQKILQV